VLHFSTVNKGAAPNLFAPARPPFDMGIVVMGRCDFIPCTQRYRLLLRGTGEILTVPGILHVAWGETGW
jgi:hypothetical protein